MGGLAGMRRDGGRIAVDRSPAAAASSPSPASLMPWSALTAVPLAVAAAASPVADRSAVAVRRRRRRRRGDGGAAGRPPAASRPPTPTPRRCASPTPTCSTSTAGSVAVPGARSPTLDADVAHVQRAHADPLPTPARRRALADRYPHRIELRGAGRERHRAVEPLAADGRRVGRRRATTRSSPTSTRPAARSGSS